MTREPEDTEKVIEAHPAPFWEGAQRILQRDKNFRWFLGARILSQFATMGFSFYIVYALRAFQLDAITAGYLTATLTISQTVANIGMGWIGDRIGHRTMLVIGAAAAVLSSVLAWFATSITWFYPIFILSGLTNVSIWTIGMTMTVDFSDEKDRPFYIGLAQTFTAPATIIAPLIGGWIADTMGFTPTFALSAILSVVMMAMLWFIVKDPRKHINTT
jgi:MFS family permease